MPFPLNWPWLFLISDKPTAARTIPAMLASPHVNGPTSPHTNDHTASRLVRGATPAAPPADGDGTPDPAI
jgi:hypothetical protein